MSIVDSKQHLSLFCKANSVTVDGSDNVITLLGPCAALSVAGSNNQIYLQMPTTITDIGSGNAIHCEACLQP